MKRGAAFKMYDAVPSSSSGNIAPSETDKEIEKFLPMLKDYLNGESCPARHGIPITQQIVTVNDIPLPSPSEAETNGDIMDEDYVFDVFYHRPTTFQELYEPGASNNIAKL